MTLVAGHSWPDWKHGMVAWARHHGIAIPASFSATTDSCAAPCHKLIGEIQHHAHLQVTNNLDVATAHLLAPLLPGPTPQERFLAELHWGINHEASIHYSQNAGDRESAMSRWGVTTPLSTDCSGAITAAAKRSRIPDPNGLKYSPVGYTGTMLGHLAHIHQADTRLGDLVIWGTGEGDHVAAIIQAARDPLLFSHGFEGGPLSIRFSVESRYHVGQPVTWLRLRYT